MRARPGFTALGLFGLTSFAPVPPANAAGPTGVVTVEAPEVTGPLSAGTILREIKGRAGVVKACYERSLVQAPDLGGRMTLQWTVRPDGTLTGVTVATSTVGVPDVGDCLEKVVSRWHFPAAPAGPTTVSVCLGLRSSGARNHGVASAGAAPKETDAHGPLAALPICATPDPKDPLSAICLLSRPYTMARFECGKPEPLDLCPGRFANWGCRHLFDSSPKAEYQARLDYDGPEFKEGAMVDLHQFHMVGSLHGLRVQFPASGDAAGRTHAKEVAATLRKAGCTSKRTMDAGDFYLATLDCGSWKASVRHQNIRFWSITVEVAEPKYFDCDNR